MKNLDVMGPSTTVGDAIDIDGVLNVVSLDNGSGCRNTKSREW